MPVIAVFNPKGGVGRTTTALNLLAAIARRGARPLGIDLDPRAELSQVFGARPKRAEDSICAFFTDRRPLSDVAQITRSGVVFCAAHSDLARVEATLGKGLDAIHRLRAALHEPDMSANRAVIDTSSVFGPLALNAIFACDLLLVPVSCEPLALQAAREVDRMLRTLEPVLKRRLPRRYVLTRYDEQRGMCVQTAQHVVAAFGTDDVCATRIREDDVLAESPLVQLDVFRHAPGSSGAQDYQALADELAAAGFIT